MVSILLTLILATAPLNGTVAFVGYTESVSQVYLLDIESNTTTPIGPMNIRGPLRWSPDQQWLACTVESDSGSAICLIPANGDTPVFIDHAQPYNTFPRWHAKGTKLAYQSGQFPNTIISIYDTEAKVESTWGGETTGLMRPVWLNRLEFIHSQVPNEKRDALALGGTSGLVAVKIETGESEWTTQLSIVTQDRAIPFSKNVYEYPDEEHTEWAIEPGHRDRSFIYESNDGGDREIYLMNKRRVYNISNHRAADVNPVWSPDKKWIAFESYRTGRRAIYRAHRDSGRVFPLLESNDSDFHSPTWSSDGSSIMCVSNQADTPSLIMYQIDEKISHTIPLAFTSIEYPAWKP